MATKANNFWFKNTYGISLERFCWWFGIGQYTVKSYIEDRSSVLFYTAWKIDAALKAVTEVREEYNNKHKCIGFRFEDITSRIPSYLSGEPEKIKAAVMAKYYALIYGGEETS